MSKIRPCRADEQSVMHTIINRAAEAYRGVIPADCWHEPYMPAKHLADEIAAGVSFWGYEDDGALIAVMGMQDVEDVTLIRHAYTLPEHQGKGLGAALLAHLRALTSRRILIGTWADAGWAIRFYQRHGFRLTLPEEKTSLLHRYWTVSDRQIETSVVLTS
ncbi:MAG: GNAT family N-acetyltransferase [Rhodospirillaceae bacterium]